MKRGRPEKTADDERQQIELRRRYVATINKNVPGLRQALRECRAPWQIVAQRAQAGFCRSLVATEALAPWWRSTGSTVQGWDIDHWLTASEEQFNQWASVDSDGRAAWATIENRLLRRLRTESDPWLFQIVAVTLSAGEDELVDLAPRLLDDDLRLQLIHDVPPLRDFLNIRLPTPAIGESPKRYAARARAHALKRVDAAVCVVEQLRKLRGFWGAAIDAGGDDDWRALVIIRLTDGRPNRRSTRSFRNWRSAVVRALGLPPVKTPSGRAVGSRDSRARPVNAKRHLDRAAKLATLRPGTSADRQKDSERAETAAAYQRLVASGRITPEQARVFLAL
ncbi:MAG: hypothetical protein JXR83_02015 [Deltaproteobacteria bacterium]|nr:hypothetical protein [Deltaproteobacteria bacterium]